MINKLLTKIGLRKDVGAPVHSGVNPVYFTYVSEEPKGWSFSWHSADHSEGLCQQYPNQECAEAARDFWETRRGLDEHAKFVRP